MSRSQRCDHGGPASGRCFTILQREYVLGRQVTCTSSYSRAATEGTIERIRLLGHVPCTKNFSEGMLGQVWAVWAAWPMTSSGC